jgi:hypothetical protein
MLDRIADSTLIKGDHAAVPLYGILDSTEVESGLSSGPLEHTN